MAAVLDTVNTTKDARVDGRTTRWQEHKEQRRTEVVDAALRAIEEEGTGVSVRRIAQRLELPRQVVYRHFDGREDLDEHVRRRIVDMLLAELTPVLSPDGTLSEVIRHAVGTYVSWIERHPHLHHFLVAGSSDKQVLASQAISGARTAVAARVEDLVGRALARYDGDPRLARPTAFGVLGFVDATVNSWRADPNERSLSAGQLTTYLTTALCSMLSGTARALGGELDADTSLGSLLGR